MSKYNQVVQLQKNLSTIWASVNTDYQAATGRTDTLRRSDASVLPVWPEVTDRLTALDVAADELIEFLIDDFSSDIANPTVVQEIKDFFTTPITIDLLDEEVLSKLSEPFVSVAIVRNILAIERLPIDTQNSVAFKRYSQVYKDAIL